MAETTRGDLSWEFDFRHAGEGPCENAPLRDIPIELHWELMIYRSTCVQWIMIVRAFLVQMPFTKDQMTEDTNMKIKNKTQCHRAQLGEAPSVPAEPLSLTPVGRVL